MKSATLGKRTLDAEVTNISRHGFWLFLGQEELFVSFKDFPWFKDASVAELVHVQWLHPRHIYWPDLDIDLSTDSIRYPEKFPLVSKVLRSKESVATASKAKRR